MPRGRKEATNNNKICIQQLATSTRWVERCGRIRQQLNQQTDALRQQEGTNRSGSQTRNNKKEYGQKKWKWGGMISSTLQTQENKNNTTINN
jgi:hypothetical protein